VVLEQKEINLFTRLESDFYLTKAKSQDQMKKTKITAAKAK